MATQKLTPHIVGRIFSNCKRVGMCLIWQRKKNPDGYGMIRNGGEPVRVHRIIYEHFYGPIPDGHEIDHVRSRGCFSRACCEPTHLEAVTHLENMQRTRKQVCRRGHDLTGPNLSTYRLAEGDRRCLACKRLRRRERQAGLAQSA